MPTKSPRANAPRSETRTKTPGVKHHGLDVEEGASRQADAHLPNRGRARGGETRAKAKQRHG